MDDQVAKRMALSEHNMAQGAGLAAATPSRRRIVIEEVRNGFLITNTPTSGLYSIAEASYVAATPEEVLTIVKDQLNY